ncbi:MAG: hypothetical protein ACXADY_24045 [Candidatus Hodarchaeales archaeon]
MNPTRLKDLKLILPKILKRQSKVFTEFSIWCEDDWVIKKANQIVGSNELIVNIREVYEIYSKLQKLNSVLLNFPKIYIDKEHEVLIQQRIYGRKLNKNNNQNRKLFNQMRDEYTTLLLEIGVKPSSYRLQDRNIIVDSKNNCWLVDLN